MTTQSIPTQSAIVKDSLQNRLRRIEGQVRGVQRMLDEDRECRDIVQQLTAIHAAVQNATTVFISGYAKECLLSDHGDDPSEREKMVDELLDLMARAGSRR